MPYFLVLLAIFQRFTLEDWGINTRFILNGKKHFERPLAPDGEHYALEPALRFDYGAFPFTFGSNNSQVRIQRSDHKPPFPSRYTLLGRGTEVYNATKDQPESEDQSVSKFSWSEERRRSEVAILQKAMKIGETDLFVKDHIPVLGDWEDLEYSTQTIRTDIERNGGLERSWSLKTGPRVLRILLLRKLGSIHNLEPVKFIRAWWECCLCEYL